MVLQPSSGVGAVIVGFNRQSWGIVTADDGKVWRLSSGSHAKKETEGDRWQWAVGTEIVGADSGLSWGKVTADEGGVWILSTGRWAKKHKEGKAWHWAIPKSGGGHGQKRKACRFFQGSQKSCKNGWSCPFYHSTVGLGSAGLQPPCPGVPYSFLPGPVPGSEPENLTVVQFNILADYLCWHPRMKYCPKQYREWPYRKRLIVEGIQRVHPDVLSLQEVQGLPSVVRDPDNHYQDLREELDRLGYYGASFALRVTGTGQVLKDKSVGNAIFYRLDRFDKMGRGRINIAELLRSRCAGKSTATEQHFCGSTRTQAAAWVRLRHKMTGRIVVVCSCHIVFDIKHPDIQMAQVQALLSFLGQHVLSPKDSLVLTGDFNAEPGSVIHEFCTSAAIDATRHPEALPSNPHVENIFPHGFWHDLDLRSAYMTCSGGAEPELTFLVPQLDGTRLQATLDYIFCSRGLDPCGVLQTPTLSEAAKENGGLPNSTVPSDHVPIGSSFRFN